MCQDEHVVLEYFCLKETAKHDTQTGIWSHLGVTGHGSKVPGVHLRSLERYDFDTVLLPYSYWQMGYPRYAADFNALVEMCRERNVAVQTIKSVARRSWEERPSDTEMSALVEEFDIQPIFSY